MNDNGYVYVLMNPSMKGLVKIGKTTRNPTDRAKEISSSTGVPTPFAVVYEVYFKSCSQAEKFVHNYLGDKGYRVSSNREFFEIPIKEAIDAVMNAKEHLGEIEKVSYETGYLLSNILEVAKSHEYGFGEYAQNSDKALKYYFEAIKMGYAEGYNNVGLIYLLKHENNNLAFKYLEEGIEKGCIKCHASMGFYYSNIVNNLFSAYEFYKSYMRYTPEDDLEYYHVCQYLVLFSWMKSLNESEEDIEYFDKTWKYKDEILNYFNTDQYAPLSHKNMPFYGLVKKAQESFAKQYIEKNIADYHEQTYTVEINLKSEFFTHLNDLYSDNNSNDSSVHYVGVIFNTIYYEE